MNPNAQPTLPARPLDEAGASVPEAPPGAPRANPPVNSPATPPAISAAQAAADFVAQIFAPVPAPEEAAPAMPLAIDPAINPAMPPAEVPGAQAAEPLRRPGADLRQALQDQRILILGLGASGLAMARWCLRCGAQVTVADTRAAPPQLPALQRELPRARFVPGAFDAGLVEGQNLHAVYCSPGLSPSAVAAVARTCSAHGIGMGGELDLYALALAGLRAADGYAPTVLAITGTNGKTTVTALTGQLLQRAGRSVALAGNIGPTLLDTLAGHIDAGTLPAVWVLELSSFQLERSTGFEPTAAALLNISQDHLDWHGDMAAYAAAKARIFGQTALMVLNRQDAAVMQVSALSAPSAPVTPALRPRAAKAPAPQPRADITFGADMPARAGDFGIELVGGMPWLVRASAADETQRARRRPGPPGAVPAQELQIQRLMPADALRIRGRHNAVNALAALALACAAGCPLAPMLYGLRAYRGEPHRVESVACIDGVEFFDDSKGTNVGATVAAIDGLGAQGGPGAGRRLVVIVGGQGKGQDFAPLAAPLARHARAVLLIGCDAPLIRAALQDIGVPLLDAPTLPGAVELAAQHAQPGDAVLMSPACASFDMFRDYEQRAQVFCASVRALAEAAGQPMEGLA
ncbi:UDP-N-acetylmuramoyl-L-alanine--D-glutamate ligase [Verminephrobacter eiseniae]|uniref:Mur ligase family protein n=1 Tax=Verminephrobacter eiseniae TaxID=364317 RepID=UPI0022386E35|nr:Mur ligase family protein [Verminephrobacter eiseniae]MCW5260496.1 UDP-N-acetylmuramoyl-L-alanine--D-glutamate ligase [Verminephrobacter eiseniae]